MSMRRRAESSPTSFIARLTMSFSKAAMSRLPFMNFGMAVLILLKRGHARKPTNLRWWLTKTGTFQGLLKAFESQNPMSPCV